MLLPAIRKVAADLAGSPFAEDALTDARSVEAIEAIASRHAGALEAALAE
jgi:hypothetical protein